MNKAKIILMLFFSVTMLILAGGLMFCSGCSGCEITEYTDTLSISVSGSDGTEHTFVAETKTEAEKSSSESGCKETTQAVESGSEAEDNTKKESTTEPTKESSKESSKDTASSSSSATSASESTTQKETTAPTTTPTTTPTTASTAASTMAHEHTWVADKKTVHHPAETKVVHHDAETKVVHHDAETSVVHHEEVGHYDNVQVEVSPAWDEPIYEVHWLCNTCGYDFTANGEANNDAILAHDKAHVLAGEPGGYHNEAVVVNTIHHPAEYTTEQKWIVDTPAWDETKVTPAWDETIVTKPAWDSTDVVNPAWDEEVVTGYKCSICGEEKTP